MSLSEKSKKELLQAQEEHIKKVAKSLHTAIKYSEEQGGIHLDESSTAEIHEALMRDVISAIGVKIHSENIQNYKFMVGTPYFSRCDLILNGTNEIKTFYFGKFLFSPENIYSWVAPAAKVRFEDIGEFDFETTEGNKLRGRLLRKDNYMIVDGKIIFMSSESYDYERTLVHQEYLSNRKQAGFQMQDIVALMEKAQDQVIRANPKGSFLIAGPAGSGKTTLALHRVAYLVQSPETSSNFPSEKIIVFVQDQSTKDYFSALLPNLGINNVQITTWVEWACKILKLEITNYELRIGDSEEEKDIYEFEKIESLKNFDEISFSKTKDIYTNLKEAYISKFSTNSYKIFKKQIEEKTFDRFDLTILLKIYLQREGKLSTEYLDYKVVGKAKLKKVIAKEDLLYSLIIVDEAQNYLKDQI
jgi:DNA helicase-2/ATP-dependent DNA helicase PcrA